MTEPIPSDVNPVVFEALLNMAQAEQARDFEPAVIKLGPYTTFTLIGLLQLAWRHPDLSAKHKELIEDIARPLQGLFSPDLQAELERGWDTAQDVPSH